MSKLSCISCGDRYSQLVTFISEDYPVCVKCLSQNCLQEPFKKLLVHHPYLSEHRQFQIYKCMSLDKLITFLLDLVEVMPLQYLLNYEHSEVRVSFPFP
mmetsp:Transcript_42477/g.31116  ORF Transcript_42477/g.31116 Transcript_42477/m.31116 type:complete len:99 (-) Transcript_42477:232-528(-)